MRHLAPALLLVLAIPAVAQTPASAPGKADPKLVQAGAYKVDPNHTQVVWKVDHMGFSPLYGAFGASGGTLQLDPKNLAATKLTVTFNVADMSVTSTAFADHMKGGDFFDVAKHPTASFTATQVAAAGDGARITGDLTIKGVTRPVTMQAKFFGAGDNPMNKKRNIGFTATTSIKRSDFGLGYAAPMVADTVTLDITAAFEKA